MGGAGYVLIDEPITPYSPVDEIKVWILYCLQRLKEHPDSEEWQEALKRALEMLEHSKRMRAQAARALSCTRPPRRVRIRKAGKNELVRLGFPLPQKARSFTEGSLILECFKRY